jgi:hypothetical protein
LTITPRKYFEKILELLFEEAKEKGETSFLKVGEVKYVFCPSNDKVKIK